MQKATKKIGSIVFGLLSPTDIKKMSVAKVVTPELYDREGYPVDGGLMDIRMGVIDPGLRCKSCGGRTRECIGHFGHIDLARPVIHILYTDIILNFLKATCRECGRILANEEKLRQHLQNLEIAENEKSIKARKKMISEFVNSLKTVKKCPYCTAKQKKLSLEKPSTFLEDTKRLTPIEIRARFEKLLDDDVKALGLNPVFARPEWLIINILGVPPVTIRPSITLETGERSEDDLTHKLSDIVRINQRLFENINAGAPELIIEDLWDLLQYHITTFFNNEVPQLPIARHRSGQPLKTMAERIKSKEGRIRHNLLGKRVNFSSRAVISPDPKIKFNEVGIPISVAKELTIPETVTSWNKDWLVGLVKKGPSNYPGANYIIMPNGRKKKITEDTMEALLDELTEGAIVERHVVDNDISIFNRQPSLHRMSIMCHRIKVLPGKSFRLNPAVCTPYGADFDGDEMNLHVPQNEEARAEAEILMSVQHHIISPKHGLNIVGTIQDAITGIYLLTKEMEYTREEAISLLLNVGIYSKTKFKKFKEEVSGKEVFGALLPDDFDYTGYSKGYKEGDKEGLVKIRKGMLLSGVIDQASIGEEKGGLIRAIYSMYGEEIGIDLLTKIFQLGNAVILDHGFTSAISDTDIPEKVKQRNLQYVEDAYAKVGELIKEYEDGKLDPLPGTTEEETLEVLITEVLNKVRNKIGEQVASNVSDENPTIVMMKSGAKGNLLNLAMMSASVGQQVIGGKRIKDGYMGRSLSIFKKGDLGPQARGFVRAGYKDGMSPYEYFFGAMTGRDSLMDVALRTPKSGYLYRRLASALQDVRVEYDDTVRDAEKRIVQFKYGDDGLDVSKTDGGIIDINKFIRDIKGK